ncbi:amidohydrolase family protein [Arthrobacter sp. CDRTa11]|uniref:amidohydrolase family protein n=1 Tax=Arthrobacter sp. CDRTa11 TaxID=2651199 RepID=UPI002265B64B|nr:amidohydrolase family protein [Arthrobacter sp. CDRTa11]UZX02944.1 amidohydrolase family protein [Arthrobacter sp. CDRTa11]
MQRNIIDSHTHVWNRSRHPQPWIDSSMSPINRDFSAEDLRSALSGVASAGLQVCKAVIVQAVNSDQETDDLLAAASEAGIDGVVGWVDVASDDLSDVLDRRRADPAGKLVGLRHLAHLDPDPDWLGRSDVARGLTTIGNHGLPFDVVIRHWQLSAASKAIASKPEVSFVLNHLGKPPIASGDLSAWSSDLRALADCPNTVAKLSGLTIEANWKSWTYEEVAAVMDTALEAFGADRLMFGSDWPLVRLTGGYHSWLETYLQWSSSLSPSEQEALDRGTAAATYGIG